MVGRILLIEDDADIRESMADVLRLDGHDVQCAADGASALQLVLGGARPSVILLDMMMPGMSGAEFLEQCHSNALLAGIPVVVVTAYSQVPPIARTADAMLNKPVHVDELLTLTRQLVARQVPPAPVV
ncbi:MAG: response regulator [Myxococcota bacterium]